MLKSMMSEASWTIAGMMRRPPLAPSAAHGTPSRVATTGHILASGRLPAASAFGPPGRGSNHIMPLFMVMPVPGSTTFEPKRESSVLVRATMLPSRSATERCVVCEDGFA